MAKDKEKLIAQGDKLYQKGKVDAAIKSWEEALEVSPKDVNLLNKIGDAYAKNNQIQSAIDYYLKVGDHYAKDGFFLKAIAMFKKINKHDPSRLEIYDRLADLYAKQGLAMEAKSQYQVLADYHLKQNDAANAISVYTKIAQIDPSNINVHVKLADLYVQNKQLPQALDRYETIGKMLTGKGLLDEAAQVFQKALRLEPGNAKMLEALAGVLQQKNDPAGALGILEDATKVAPTNVKLLLLLGRSYAALGRNADAEAAFGRAAAQSPDDPEVLEARAAVALKRGDASSAFAVLGPMADKAAKSGEPRRAVELLAPILKIDRHHIGTLESYVRYYQQAGEETTVLNHRNLLAEAFVSRQEWERAGAVLEELIRLEPENIQHREKLTFVQQKSGKLPPAAAKSAPAIAAPIAAPPPARPAAPPARPASPPPAAAPEPDFDETGSFLSKMDGGVVEEEDEISLEVESDISLVEPPSDLPEVALDDSSTGASDIELGGGQDFVSEHITEAEVFAKYGLVAKAIEHFELVLARVPNHRQALSRLVDLHLEEGHNGPAIDAAGRLAVALRANGDGAGIAELTSRLTARGLSLPAPRQTMQKPAPAPAPAAKPTPPPVAKPTAPPAIEFEEETIELDSSPALEVEESIEIEETIELGSAVEAPIEMELESDVEEAEPVAAEISLDDSEVAIDLSEASDIELPVESEASLVLEGDEEPAAVELGQPSPIELSLDEEEMEFPPAPPKAPIEEEIEAEIDFGIAPPPPLAVEPPPKPVAAPPAAVVPAAPPPPPAKAAKAETGLGDLDALVGHKKGKGKPTSPDQITDKFLADLGMGGEAAKKPKKKKHDAVDDLLEMATPHHAPAHHAHPVVEEPVLEEGLGDLAAEIEAAAAAAPPAPAPEEVGEIDFYVDQGLFDEARRVLSRLEQRYAGHPELAERKRRIEAAAAAAPPAPVAAEEVAEASFDMDLGRAIEEEMAKLESEAPASIAAEAAKVDEGNLFADEDNFFDLASELEQEFVKDEAPKATDAGGLQTEEASLEQIFKEFKKGVEQQLDAEDYDTHYNLGIAYKEMGLVDEAIGEFQIASKDPKRATECCSMLGLCFLEKGMPQLAIKWYRKGLDNPDIREEENLGLLYDLANVYQEVGDIESAYKSFVELYGMNANYRDVSFRLNELKEAARGQ